MEVKYKSSNFTMEVGRLTYKSVERSIKRSAFEWGLQVTVERSLGVFDGYLLITVYGEAGRVNEYIRTLETVFKGLED